MSLPEHGAKVATSTIDALRSSPGLLVLVLLQIATLGVLFFVNDRQNERRAAREMAIIERCFPPRAPSGQISVTTGRLPSAKAPR